MAEDKFVAKLIAGAFAVATAAISYAFLIRPWHLRWGATKEECRAPLPGDEIVPAPEHEATHAITINAPVADLWPWLVQIGQDKGGFYSYTWLENLAGCHMHNADRLVPEWQGLKVGDVVRLHPKAPPLPVRVVEPYRAIVLGGLGEVEEGDGSVVTAGGTWGMYLKEVDKSTTRLLIRLRLARQSGVKNWLSYDAVLEPAHFIMERKMMRNIKKRAEGMSPRAPSAEKVCNKSRVASASPGPSQ